MRIKRLSLLPFMKNPQFYRDADEIKPIFGKDGWYLASPTMCWYEYNDRAFRHSADCFRFEMAYQNTPLLRKKHIGAINVLREIPEFGPILQKMDFWLLKYKIETSTKILANKRRKKR